MKKLQNKKADGLDGIPPEVWKTGKFNDLLLYYCNEVYKGNVIQSWTEGCILAFLKKGDLSKTSNYRGITLTSIAAKIYNALLLNRIQPEMEKILRRNQNGFRKGRSKAFDSVHGGKMEKILLAYGIPKEIVTAIMILYRNTKSMVRSPDGDTEFFDTFALRRYIGTIFIRNMLRLCA